MSKVAVVTDSSHNLPSEILKGYPVFVVPLHLTWGDDLFLDGIDIQTGEFYERLKNSKIMPTTSQPSPNTFKNIYRQLLDQGYEILSVHLAAKLSGTIESALQAKAALPDAPIEIVDSETTSVAMGFQALAAARMAAQGATLADCKIVAEQARDQSGVYFTLNTLEYLRAGGRIGGGAAFLGTLLNLKPILEIRDGRVEAVERVRTMNKAINRLLELFEQRIGKRYPIRICALHSCNQENANILLERARHRFGVSEVSEAFTSEISPVIGTHAGPGALGLAFLAGM
jgi:DegV family protein with EDD domain